MGLLSYSRALVGRTLENVADVQQMLNEAKASINFVELVQLAPEVKAGLAQPGMVTVTAGPDADAGWLLCDGASYPITTYPALYQRLGGAASPFGQTATTFQVPDLRGRTPIGVGTGDAAGATAKTRGTKYGEETHKLTGPESGIAGHSHAAPPGSLGMLAGYTSGGSLVLASGAALNIQYNQAPQAAGPTTAAQAHSLLGPVTALHYQIKT